MLPYQAINCNQHRWRKSQYVSERLAREKTRKGNGGDRDLRRWERGRLYLTLLCHHQNDSCIEMGRDEIHFNVSLIVRDKVTRQCPQTITFQGKGESKQNRTEVLLLTSLTPHRKAKAAHTEICKIPLSAFCRPRQPKQHGNNGQLTIKTQTRLVLFKLHLRYSGCRRDT